MSYGKVKFLEVLGEGLFVKVCKGVLLKVDLELFDVEIVIKCLKIGVLFVVVENFKCEIFIFVGF